MALAKQLDNRPQEALVACEKAVSICQMRLDRLYKEQEAMKASQVDTNGKLDQEERKGVSEEDTKMEESDRNGSGQEISKPIEVEKNASSEESLEKISEADEKETSKFAKLDAEIKEIEESLVDLREKVEELKQMASAPSLFEALKAENPEAATMMSEAVGAVFQKINRAEGTSSMAEKSASFPGSSSAEGEPVTHLGIVGRGIKRAALIPITEDTLLPPDVQRTKRTAQDSLNGSVSAEPQIGSGEASLNS
ncbi:hypothetical protein R1sor_013262 [Riccia sorocarpa]|uniref:Uncharacterized protein n=1 Tax=Riccia sorocarpa TaxID=122646 RepID=A0ABD3H674_9MARC